MRRFDRLQHDELEVGPLSRAKRVLLEDQLAFLRMKKPSTSALALRHRLAPPCLAKKVAIRSQPVDDRAHPRIGHGVPVVRAEFGEEPRRSHFPVRDQVARLPRREDVTK